MRAADEDDAAGEVGQDKGAGAGAVQLGNGLEGGRGDDGELGRVGVELIGRGADEELVDEQGVPGVLGDDADGQTVGRIGAAEEILHEEFAGAQIREDALEERVEFLSGDGLVDAAPVDLGVGEFVVHNELVFGAAAGARSGGGDKCAVRGELGLAAAQRGFHELGNGLVERHA